MRIMGKLSRLMSSGNEPSALRESNESNAENDLELKQHQEAITEKKKLIASLTPRERDTFYQLLKGYTLNEAAEHLGIKYSTANTHMTQVYRKLGINTKAQLIINFRDIV